MATATFHGCTLDFDVVGDESPIVFVHGALIADAFVSLVVEPSLRNHYQLITYRRRGYRGSSPAAGGLTVHDQAEDARNLLLHLGVEKAHIVGHSFGGVIALELARAFPSLVHTLTLLEPALMVGSSAAGYRESLAAGIRQFRDVDPQTAVDEMLRARWPDYRARLPAVLPFGFDEAVAAAPAAFDAELPSLFEWSFDEKGASRIVKPVLSVVGEKSDSLSPRFREVHRWLLDHIGGCEGYVLPGAHHFLQLENSRDLAAALASFCGRHPLPG